VITDFVLCLSWVAMALAALSALGSQGCIENRLLEALMVAVMEMHWVWHMDMEYIFFCCLLTRTGLCMIYVHLQNMPLRTRRLVDAQ